MRHLVTGLLSLLAFVAVVLAVGAALDHGPGLDIAPLAAGAIAALVVVALRMPRQRGE